MSPPDPGIAGDSGRDKPVPLRVRSRQCGCPGRGKPVLRGRSGQCGVSGTGQARPLRGPIKAVQLVRDGASPSPYGPRSRHFAVILCLVGVLGDSMHHIELRHLRTVAALRGASTLVEAAERVYLTQFGAVAPAQGPRRAIGLHTVHPARPGPCGSRRPESACCSWRTTVLPLVQTASLDLARLAGGHSGPPAHGHRMP